MPYSTPKVKLDLKDKKLLTALDENARYSNAQLARKVGLSKPAVEYRIQRFHKNNVIFSHYTVINVTKLGYSQYKIYLKFQNTSIENENKIISYWTKDPNSVWVGQIRGIWDLAVSVLAKSNFEFGSILSAFMNKFSQFVLEKDVLLTEYSPIYAREYLSETEPSEFVYGVPSKNYILNETDRKIVKILSNNAKIPIVDLAKKTALSRDNVTYRIKKLTEEGIIVQYRTYLNLSELGIRHYKIIFRTKNLSPQEENRVKQYVKDHKQSTQFLKLIGSYDMEIEFEVENEDELYSILQDIREKFSNIIRDFGIIRITKTVKYDYFPFN
ncbi:MAG: winged helix-turn-helix transcriptional regulator [archaeon]